MKKRCVILVEEDIWKDIKKRAIDSGQSAGDFLISLVAIKSSDDKLIDNFRSKISVQDYEGNEIKTNPADTEVIKTKPANAGSIKIGKYSEEYRKKNPRERCSFCGKALDMNCGH